MVRSIRIVGITVLFQVVFFAIIKEAPATTYTVKPTGKENALQSIIDLTHQHDTVLIMPGIHIAVNVSVNHPITIIGSEGAILNGKGEGYLLKILADSVTIEGVTFINAGRSYTKDFAAIYVHKANQFVIRNNEIRNPFFGCLIEKSHHGIISNNLITGNSVREDDSGNGIHMWHCSNISVENNKITGMRDGIYLEFVSDSKVRSNKSQNNIRYGLHFMFSNNDDYTGNYFISNGAGVAVMFSKYITMRNNHFSQNWGAASYGLLLKEIYDAEVIGNHFDENTVGIFVEGSTRVNYQSNFFHSNGWAVKVSGGCYLNSFKKNNFLSNSFDVAYNGKINDNEFNNNYWSSYSGYDLDKDGVGDVPFRPVNLFSYVVNKTPEAIILLRSLFVDIINFSEKVSPVFTPDNLVDDAPSMKEFP